MLGFIGERTGRSLPGAGTYRRPTDGKVRSHVVAAETKELRHVHDQIAVRQHRPLLTPVVPPVYCRHAMTDGSKPLI
jgi:hypothetical protein